MVLIGPIVAEVESLLTIIFTLMVLTIKCWISYYSKTSTASPRLNVHALIFEFAFSFRKQVHAQIEWCPPYGGVYTYR